MSEELKPCRRCGLYVSSDGIEVTQTDTGTYTARFECPDCGEVAEAAARIWLEVTDVRPERLLDISSHDADCEGFTEAGMHPRAAFLTETHPRATFFAAWEQHYGYGSTSSNPWLWVIEFRVINHE